MRTWYFTFIETSSLWSDISQLWSFILCLFWIVFSVSFSYMISCDPLIFIVQIVEGGGWIGVHFKCSVISRVRNTLIIYLKYISCCCIIILTGSRHLILPINSRIIRYFVQVLISSMKCLKPGKLMLIRAFVGDVCLHNLWYINE